MPKNLNLKKISTRAPSGMTKEKALKELEKMKAEIIELQNKFYADGRHALLIVLQGMDASGKDGTVRHVLGGVNPSGMRVYGWRKPVGAETKHDYLWRLHNVAPERGMIHVWNRSHYEDILVPTVLKFLDKEVIEKRYDHINIFEKMLTDEGTIIVKCYLHMSKDTQLERLEERMLEPEKYWKSTGADFDSRALWDDYMNAYETMIPRTDTEYAPWHIIPVDNKWYKLYLVAKTVLAAMKSVDLEWPALTAENIPESVRRDVEEKKARAKVEAEMMKEYKKTGEISLQKTEKKSSKK
ncbi:polyphosphate kinase 2 family protein [Candidatus Gracilibacteria bacterium]|nr:polyphosphate kinase 2 family protein [Candidatus Gracilibacteria bacterium]